MNKSLFVRMFGIYLLVSAISLTILGVLVSEIFRTSFLEQRRNAMLSGVSELLRLTEQFSAGRISETAFLYQLTAKAREMDINVWLADADNNIRVMSDESDKRILEDEGLSQAVSAMYANSMQGSTMQIVSVTPGDSAPFILISTPVKTDGEVTGVVFMNADLTSMYRSLKNIYGQIVVSAMMASAFVFLLVYFLSRYITRDISKITHAARQISKGNYKARVDIKSRNELGELGDTFNKMAQDIEQLNGLRTTFVANVSHELRTPMTAIQGFVQGMIDGAISEGERDYYLNLVLSETKRLNKLISDLLELSKVESGKFPLNIIPFDINELLCQCLITFEQKVEDKKIEVKVELDGEKLMVNADPDRIAQVITNLIDNAVKFCREGGELTAATKINANKVEVSVSDSGDGIPESEIPYIFERFYKVDKSHQRSRPGYGIGLSIVKKIIDQHHEKIWIKSEMGRGTTFTFTLGKQ